jgi:hypothetical protein
VDPNGYVTFLIVGVLLVAVDAVIVFRSGRAYLDEAYRDPRASRSMVQLVTVLFCLVVLGVLALISTIDIDAGGTTQTVVVKLGIVLLVLAAAHAAAITILSHMRDRLRDEQITDELVDQRSQNNNARGQAPTVNPIGEEYHKRHPAVSPPIEDMNNPYSPTS